jgi:hypothetical protein
MARSAGFQQRQYARLDMPDIWRRDRRSMPGCLGLGRGGRDKKCVPSNRDAWALVSHRYVTKPRSRSSSLAQLRVFPGPLGFSRLNAKMLALQIKAREEGIYQTKCDMERSGAACFVAEPLR